MRYPAEQKESTRAKLVSSSARLAKKKGFAASGVDSLTAAAGLSGGGFYKHFTGKAELLRAIVEHELARSFTVFFAGPQVSGKRWLRRTVEQYFGRENVLVPEAGCMLPSLAGEIARSDPATRRSFEGGMRRIVQAVAPQVGGEAAAWAVLAQLVGAVVIARALATPAARQAVFDACGAAIAGSHRAGTRRRAVVVETGRAKRVSSRR
jgi:AcrR family transcriptional regulator